MQLQDFSLSTILQHKLSCLRDDADLCDLILIAEKRRFSCHRIILAAFSDYFRTLLFNSNFRESRDKEITLYSLTAKTLDAILSFLYTSYISFDESNIEEIVEACDLFQISILKAAIHYYLKNILCPSNCYKVYALAKRYRLSIEKNAFLMCVSHFPQSLDDPLYSGSYDIFLDIISSSLLCGTEKDVLKVTLKWVQCDRKNRLYYLPKLLPHINKVELTQTQVTEAINELQCDQEIIRCVDSFMASGCCLTQYRYKSLREVLIIVGGSQFDRSLRTCSSMIVEKEDWKLTVPISFSDWNNVSDTITIASMKTPREDAAIAYADNKIYIAGGHHQFEECLSECELYEWSQNTWSSLPDLPESLTALRGVLWEGNFVVSGGRGLNGPSDKVWMLKESGSKWVALPSLPEPRYSHGFVCYANILYIIGGFVLNDLGQPIPTNDCYRFDEMSNKWARISSMSTARACFGCCVFGDMIYAISGFKDYPDTLTQSIERYDILKNRWTNANKLNFISIKNNCYANFAVTVARGRIFCIGGRNGSGALLHTVDVLNPLTYKWRWGIPMQASKTYLAAATLRIPVMQPTQLETWFNFLTDQ